MEYESVIGLEVHAQLSTVSKIFCGCSTEYGAEPNTQVCPICLGLPGSLPVLNREVIHLAVKAGLALGCTIHHNSRMARKNYFYPDLPKGYQISQYDEPLATNGRLRFKVNGEDREVGIIRVHIEEDAGKSLHGYGAGTGVDFNRCGVGLIEIVSRPDIRSPAEARAYLARLKQVLEYTAVSDCNMEEGSLRVDANVSVRPVGQDTLGVKTEVKNMNSFKAVEQALAYEIKRQIEVLKQGGRIEQVTLLWNDAKGTAEIMRRKEAAHDYRYFPEPDLLPLALEEKFITDIQNELPELPWEKEQRFQEQYALNDEMIRILTGSLEIADYFEKVAATQVPPRKAAAWVASEVLRIQKERDLPLSEFPITPERLGELIKAEQAGKLNHQAARQIFEQMLESKVPVQELIEKSGLAQVDSREAIDELVQGVLADHPAEVQRYRDGEERLLGFFMGQVMKRSKGRANPQQVREMLLNRLKEA